MSADALGAEKYTCSHCSSDMSSASTIDAIPALFTRMSIFPYSSSVFSTIFSTSALLHTSASTAITRRPYLLRPPATFSSSSRDRAAIARSQPAFASPAAKLIPSPRDTPVTIADLPPRSNICIRLSCIADYLTVKSSSEKVPLP